MGRMIPLLVRLTIDVSLKTQKKFLNPLKLQETVESDENVHLQWDDDVVDLEFKTGHYLSSQLCSRLLAVHEL